VFEAKPTFSRQWLLDAADKAASVRDLYRTSVPVIAGGTKRSAIRPKPILAGLPATDSVWNPGAFAPNLRRALASLDYPLDLGCSLDLRAKSAAPAAGLMLYARTLRSFRK